jgi:hypothetical protein
MRKELRNQLRYELQVPVEIEWQSNTGKQKNRGFTKDISSKGVFLFCKSEIPVGSYVRLNIFLRYEGLGPRVTIDCTARVCRVVHALAEGDLAGIAVVNRHYKVKGRLSATDLVA